MATGLQGEATLRLGGAIVPPKNGKTMICLIAHHIYTPAAHDKTTRAIPSNLL